MNTLLKITLSLIVMYLIPWILSYTINGYAQSRYLNEIINQLLMLIYIYIYIRTIHNNKVDLVLDKIIKVILFQNLIGIFIYPWKNLILNLNLFFTQNLNFIKVLEREMGKRIVGLGTAFFGMGIENSVALIFLSYLISKNSKKTKYYLSYLLVLVLGSIASRTTIIGFLFSLVYFVLNLKFLKVKEILLNFNKVIVYFFILFGIFIGKFSEKILKLLSFGFEIFINFFIKGSFESESTNHLQTMYIFPKNLKTILFGDGLFITENGYYMSTDVGYLRDLYYTGIIGLFFTILFKFLLFLFIKKECNDKMLIKLSFVIFLMDLTLNLKGWTNLNKFQYIFIAFIIYNKNIKYKNKSYKDNFESLNINI